MSYAASLAAGQRGQVQRHRAATFLERGLVLPYTSAHLVGARLRFGAKGALELVFPNPSGQEGWYVIELAGVNRAYSPTLHDRDLNGRFAALASLSPGVLRVIARQVAAEGLAGRAAAQAAAVEIAQETQRGAWAPAELLREMVRQIDPSAVVDGIETVELVRRVQTMLRRVRPDADQTMDSTMTRLMALGQAYRAIGIGRQAETARVPHLIGMLETLVRDLGTAFQGAPGNANDAAMVLASAEVTLAAARHTFQRARAPLSDIPGLLRRWESDPDSVLQALMRPEWLLDGWERICLLGLTEDPIVPRRLTLAEMASLLPMLPAEALRWVDDAIAERMRALSRVHRVLQGDGGGVTDHDLVARNERLRALAPSGPE